MPEASSSSASVLKELPTGSTGVSGAVIVGVAVRSIPANTTSIITSASIFPPCNGAHFANAGRCRSGKSFDPSARIARVLRSKPYSVPSRNAMPILGELAMRADSITDINNDDVLMCRTPIDWEILPNQSLLSVLATPDFLQRLQEK